MVVEVITQERKEADDARTGEKVIGEDASVKLSVEEAIATDQFKLATEGAGKAAVIKKLTGKEYSF